VLIDHKGFHMLANYLSQTMPLHMRVSIYSVKRATFKDLHIKGLKITCWIKARFPSFVST
jgi:hypothetical protein